MIILALILLISVFCFSSKEGVALNVSIFVIPSLLFQFIALILPGMYLYLVGAALDVFILGAFYLFGRTSNLLIALSLISFISILLNFAGWSMYMDYKEPLVHDISFMVLYFVAFLACLFSHVRTSRVNLGLRRSHHERG